MKGRSGAAFASSVGVMDTSLAHTEQDRIQRLEDQIERLRHRLEVLAETVSTLQAEIRELQEAEDVQRLA
jgi:phage shock protein A